MQPTGHSEIRDLVKRYMSISDLADVFGVSRPTIYSIMDAYDARNTDAVPNNIGDFLDLISDNPDPMEVRTYVFEKATPKDSRILEELRIRGASADDMADLIKSRKDLIREADMTQRELRTLNDEYMFLMRSVGEMDLDSLQDGDDKARLDELMKRKMALRERISELQLLREDVLMRLHRIEASLAKAEESRAVGAASRSSDDGWTEDGSLRTLCIGSNGRSMVIFQLSPELMDRPFRAVVTVSMETPAGDATLGRYRPGPERNFVNIDDILPKVKAFYRVSVETADGTVSSERYPLRMR